MKPDVYNYPSPRVAIPWRRDGTPIPIDKRQDSIHSAIVAKATYADETFLRDRAR